MFYPKEWHCQRDTLRNIHSHDNSSHWSTVLFICVFGCFSICLEALARFALTHFVPVKHFELIWNDRTTEGCERGKVWGNRGSGSEWDKRVKDRTSERKRERERRKMREGVATLWKGERERERERERDIILHPPGHRVVREKGRAEERGGER